MLKLLAVVIALIAALALVLGHDLRPWARTLRSDARAELEDLVSAHRLHLAKAEQAVEDGRRRAVENEHALAASRAAVRRLEGELIQARAELEAETRKLEPRTGGMTNAETGGRNGPAGPDERASVRIRNQDARCRLAAERVRVLEDVLRRHRERVAALETVVRDAPAELEKLELSVRHLKEKVQLYEELTGLPEVPGDRESGYREARRVLDAAHADVDARLKAVDVRLPAGAGSDVGDGSPVGRGPGL